MIYKKLEDEDFSKDYLEKLSIIVKDYNINEVSLFEVEDKKFENKLIETLKNLVKINYIISPMFLTTREEFKNYIGSVKKALHGSVL